MALRETLGIGGCEAEMASIDQVLGGGWVGGRMEAGEADGEEIGKGKGEVGSCAREKVGEMTGVSFEEIKRNIADWDRNVERSRRLREKLEERVKEHQGKEEVRFDEIDFEASEMELENERREQLPKQAGSKYHCLLQRHMFVRPVLSEPVLDKGEDSWVVCQKCGGKVWEGDCFVCEVPECGFRACSACVRKWENERRAKATGRWRLGTWERN